MTDQLSFSLGGPPPPTPPGVPPVIAEILHAARSMAFSIRIVRGTWGVGIGPKRRWVRTGDCCCALGAALITKGVVADPYERSPRASVIRTFRFTNDQLEAFIHGFDDHWWVLDDVDSEWFRYGAMVAEETVNG